MRLVRSALEMEDLLAIGSKRWRVIVVMLRKRFIFRGSPPSTVAARPGPPQHAAPCLWGGHIWLGPQPVHDGASTPGARVSLSLPGPASWPASFLVLVTIRCDCRPIQFLLHISIFVFRL